MYVSRRLLLRTFLPFQDPTIAIKIAETPSLVKSDNPEVAGEQRLLLKDLYTHALRFRDTGLTLGKISGRDREEALSVLRVVGGERLNAESLADGIQAVFSMERALATRFVAGERAHQLSPDGRFDHSADPILLLLAAFFPHLDFQGRSVVGVNRHKRLEGFRSYRALSRLISGAWFEGQRSAVHRAEDRIERFTTELERHLFSSVTHAVPDNTLSVQFNPQAGFCFENVLRSSTRMTAKLVMMPRHIVVAMPSGQEVPVPVYFESRAKGPMSRFRKHIVGREVTDGIAVRLIVENKLQYQLLEPVLRRVLFNHATRVKVVDGKRTDGDNHNPVSVSDNGILWHGIVRLDGASAEVQVVTMSAYWNRKCSITPESDTWYKAKQWLLPPKDNASEREPLPPAIQLVFPPALFPEWTEWKHVVDTVCVGLMRTAATYYPWHGKESTNWVCSVRQKLLADPWKL